MSSSSRLFVLVPPMPSDDAFIIFGMNSVCPVDDVQEVVCYPAAEFPPGATVKCTYREVSQVQHVNGVVLSKLVGKWGAEMGANEHGVVIGCSEVHKADISIDDGLTGGDLVRIGLERASSASNAVDIISDIVGSVGLGLQSDDGSFPVVNVTLLICDKTEAWIVEAAGKHMAALRLGSGLRCMSGEFSIGTTFDKSTPDLKKFAIDNHRWSEGDGDIDFAKAFSLRSDSRASADDMSTFQQHAEKDNFSVLTMLEVLRDPVSTRTSEGFTVAGSMLSLLPRSAGDVSVHWFTATARPAVSFFKPFVFGGRVGASDQALVCGKTTAPIGAEGEHQLWTAHKRFVQLLDAGDAKIESVLTNIRELEHECFGEVNELIKGEMSEHSSNRVASLFEHMVDLEINFYGY